MNLTWTGRASKGGTPRSTFYSFGCTARSKHAVRMSKPETRGDGERKVFREGSEEVVQDITRERGDVTRNPGSRGGEGERERVREVHDMIVRFGGKLGWQHDFLGGPGMVGMCRGPHIGRVMRTTLLNMVLKDVRGKG